LTWEIIVYIWQEKKRAAAAQQAERERRKLLFTQEIIIYAGKKARSGSPTGRERSQKTSSRGEEKATTGNYCLHRTHDMYPPPHMHVSSSSYVGGGKARGIVYIGHMTCILLLI